MKLPTPPIMPMSTRAVRTFPIGEGWIYEPKWDGFRCLIFRNGEGMYLQSRSGKDLTSRFPEIVAAILGFDNELCSRWRVSNSD
ncbi:MAG: hypothetical protein JO076_00445 [Verrucomicrobia bacterium]|nr:hypothetical protein [Verrucomicrobiota bacterium]